MLSFEKLDKRLLLSATVAPAGDVPAADAQAATVITSVRDGLWSNPATWNAGRVPTSADDVVIANNVTIDQGSVHELDINAGTATLAGSLQAYGSVIVRSTLAGSQGGIYFHVASDRADVGNSHSGPNAGLSEFHPQDVGLWALPGSHVNLQGSQVTSWANAVGSGASQNLGHGVSQRVALGATSATLAAPPVGWQAGDTLLMVNEQGQSVLADLVSVQGASIQYHQHKTQASDPDLIGHELVTVGSNTVVSPKIANLSRHVQIASADVHEGDTNHRAFTVALEGSTVNFVNVEFRDLGPRGKLGRYPIYFDAASSGSSLTGSSVWQDVTDAGNRFVALAGAHGITVSDNVAFRSRGNGFFMEDASDYGNTISHNLSVQVTGDEELSIPNSNVTELSHHYWLRTGNTISGNVAAGGGAIGMMVLASSHPDAQPIAGTEAFGTGLFGMWTGAPNVTFTNPVAVYNERTGFAADPAWDVDSHGATLNNPLFLFNGTDDSSYGSQVYSNNGDRTVVNGGVLAGVKALHTHYHSSITVTNALIDVDTLMVPTYWEQAAVLSHDQIRASLLFERAYPSPRYVSPGVVRIVDSQLQIDDEPVEQETADYIGDAFQNYPALQGEPIPNGIELDHPAADSGFIRVTMLSDQDRWMTNIARWTVTPIGQTPIADTFIYHRQTAWNNLSGYGGYPDGFPPGEYAVKLYTEDGTLLKSGFAVVRSGQVSDLTDTLDTQTQVVGRQLFYNQSKFDGNTSGASASDDAAIATDKSAYRPGSGAATFANLSSYSRGINGIMVDIQGAHGTLTASDFTFKVGANNTPSTWTAAQAPASIVVRPGAGIGGSDRVEIVWTAATAPKNTWLEVIVKGNDATGGFNTNTHLASSDVFFFGNKVGESGAGTATLAQTTLTDVSAARGNTGVNASITNAFDFDRSGVVNLTDVNVARTNIGNLTKINISNPPAAPQAVGEEQAVASALAAPGVTPAAASPTCTAPSSTTPGADLPADNSARPGPLLQRVQSPHALLSHLAADEFGEPDDELIALLAGERLAIGAGA